MKKRVALLCNETDRRKFIELLDIYKKKQFKEPPKECLQCFSKVIAQLEIVGISKACMFWECVSCGKKYLRYSKSYTYKLLKTLEDFYINPDDFIDIQDKEPN